MQVPTRDGADKKIVPPPSGFYSNYFKGIIGVSRKKGCQEHDIILRAHTHYIYKLMETKKLHRTQTIIKEFGKYEGKQSVNPVFPD